VDHVEQECRLDTLRGELGNAAFAAAWSEGHEMDLETAILLATATTEDE
jgi:hypothetical protein